jgi:hypothetical protein
VRQVFFWRARDRGDTTRHRADVGGPPHQIEARLGCEIALFLMSTAKTPGPRDIFANSERHSLEADEQINEQVITCFYL